MNRNKRGHDSSSEVSDVEELDSFYNDEIDFNDSFSSDEQGDEDPLGSEQGDEDPLGSEQELDLDVDEDPLGEAENCALNFEFNDPVEDDEYNFDKSDDSVHSYEEFESEPESDTEADTEDSDDTYENVATVSTVSKGEECVKCFLLTNSKPSIPINWIIYCPKGKITLLVDVRFSPVVFYLWSNCNRTMLWEKEMNGDLYVDLFENVKYPIHLCRLKREKRNSDALAARIAGNEKFKDGDFHGAMAKYNQSMCFAENGSEYLGIAYGDRSCCFEKLKMFSYCLTDIQLQSEQSISANQPTMSFPADENIPSMANSIRIDVNDEYRRLISATRHIQIDETVLIEEEYVRLVVGENIMCSNCGKKNVNFIPCDKCGGAMFCSEFCSKNNFHRIECDILFDANICSNGNFFPVFVLRSIIIALSAFSSTTEMMDFVENCRTTDPYEIPFTTSTAISKYRAFFKLSAFVPDMQLFDHRKIAYSVYHSIISSSLAARFQTKSHQRFLTHLIIHHIYILRTNSFGCFESPAIKSGQSIANTDYNYELSLVGSYFNHSCCPNVAKLRKNNLSIYKTILPIREGEQLFISYVDEDDDEYKTEIGRQRFLQNNFGFNCRCAICEEGILKNTLLLQDDKVFVKVVKDFEKLKIKFDLLIVREIIKNCKVFLTKFSEWNRSAESIYIKHNLVAMLQLEIDCQI